MTLRTLLSIAAAKDWIVYQLDVGNVFLRRDLTEDIYMKIPQGFAEKNDNIVCKLHNSLYGLRQASRNWYDKSPKALKGIDISQCAEQIIRCLYTKGGRIITTALIYVNDVILSENEADFMKYVKTYLYTNFSIKDLGKLKYFWSIEISISEKGIVLSKRKYVLDILKETGMTSCKSSKLPMEQNCDLRSDKDDAPVDPSKYKRLFGRLLYLTITTPDITYVVNLLCQHMPDPKEKHMDVVNRIVRYLKFNPGQGLILTRSSNLKLVAYCDSDWAGCPITIRSCTGYVMMLGGVPVSWHTKKQSLVVRSSAEAEYKAITVTVNEVIWLRWLLLELGISQDEATTLHCDN